MRKLALSLALAGATVAAAVGAQTTPAAARTDVHLGFGVNFGFPGYYYGYPVGYYGPPVYVAPPRWRVRCHRPWRRVRYWSYREGRWRWRWVRGPRRCHRHRVW